MSRFGGLNIFNENISPFQTHIFDNTDATSITSGALQVDGGISCQKSFYAGGIIRSTTTTQSNSVSTGSIVGSGGLGIALDAYVGGTIHAGGINVDSVSLKDGTVLLPSLSFQNDVDGGMYRIGDGDFGFSVEGVKVAEFSSVGITASLTGNVTGNCTGSSGSCTGNSVTATTATNANNVNLTNNVSNNDVYIAFSQTATGNQQISTDTNFKYHPSTQILTVPNIVASTNLTVGTGSQSAPSICFSTDSDDGIYHSGTDQMTVVANNTAIMDMSPSSVHIYPTLTGTITNVSISNDTTNADELITFTKGDSTLYSVSGFSINPSTLEVKATKFTGALSGLFANGTVGAPSISFTNDTDTGIYYTGTADNLAIACNGVQQMLLTPSATTIVQPTTCSSTLAVSSTTDATDVDGSLAGALQVAGAIMATKNMISSARFSCSPWTFIANGGGLLAKDFNSYSTTLPAYNSYKIILESRWQNTVAQGATLYLRMQVNTDTTASYHTWVNRTGGDGTDNVRAGFTLNGNLTNPAKKPCYSQEIILQGFNATAGAFFSCNYTPCYIAGDTNQVCGGYYDNSNRSDTQISSILFEMYNSLVADNAVTGTTNNLLLINYEVYGCSLTSNTFV